MVYPWFGSFYMYFPFRYEMGSPGVFEEIVNSSDEGGYFEGTINKQLNR